MDELTQALNKFADAANALQDVWLRTEDDGNHPIIDSYPSAFDGSFDKISLEIESWRQITTTEQADIELQNETSLAPNEKELFP